MRDVAVDEIFTWKDDLARKAKEAFGCHHAYANEKTYNEIKGRCDFRERPGTMNWLSPILASPVGLNSFHIHIDDAVPDGILRGKT